MPHSLDGVIIHSQGSRILGTFWLADADSKRPTVLLLHGIPGVEKQTDLAYALREAGWNCLAIHYRGCWGSEGNYSLPGILDDIAAAVDYLCAHPRVDTDRLAAVGLSLGGWGVVMAGARDSRLRAIVSMNPLVDPTACPLDDKTSAGFASLLRGITPDEVKAQWMALTPLPQVAHQLTGKPTLLLTGDADTLFPPEHIRPLADAMPFAEWKRLLDANHTFDNHRRLAVQTVIDWLAHSFSPILQFSPSLTLRHPAESDHPRILAVLSEWWGGRDLSHLLPRLYFQHFSDTSLIVERDGELIAFLIGFASQSEPGAAYIHFVGVHPEQRKSGIARRLYEHFFEWARARGAREVHLITSPVNSGSIAFHKRMGFMASGPIPDYDGPGDDRVAFKKTI